MRLGGRGGGPSGRLSAGAVPKLPRFSIKKSIRLAKAPEAIDSSL